MVYCVDTLGGSDLPYKKKKNMEEFVPNPCYSIARRPWFLGWTVRVPYQAGDIELWNLSPILVTV